MISYVEGDIFRSPAQILVNPVNTDGIMGKGLAKEFKHRFPEMFKHYQSLCENKQFSIGQLFLYKTPNHWILNFPTKQSWRHKSKTEYIEAGLQKFVATYLDEGMFSVGFPQLGCGNGDLDWITQVKPLMEYYLQPLPIEIYIHLFDSTVTSD